MQASLPMDHYLACLETHQGGMQTRPQDLGAGYGL